MHEQTIQASNDEREREEEALAAMAGLTLWRARDAIPSPAVAEQRPNLLTRLPPFAWSMLFL